VTNWHESMIIEHFELRGEVPASLRVIQMTFMSVGVVVVVVLIDFIEIVGGASCKL